MLEQVLKNIIEKDLLYQATFSNPFKKDKDVPSKIGIRPLKSKGDYLYQISEYRNQQVFHRNVTPNECLEIMSSELIANFKQGLLQTKEGDVQLLTNRKGETTILQKKASKSDVDLEHNRQKKHLLIPEQAVLFLKELGLTNENGKIYPQKMDKFRQINRFLEMVSDLMPAFEKQKKLNVIDFGCGKAYLTFALYHFLTEIKGYETHMTGIDRKEEVIDFCRDLAKTLHYNNLKFEAKDIAHYQPESPVDMVVALHACDTATDIALAKAVKWQAKTILAAPCCQHELYNQMVSEDLAAILKQGILRERMASIATDAARVQLLEMSGYSTQILEFIDSEHTPKNLLIRAVRGNSQERREKAGETYQNLKKALGISPTLEKLLVFN